MNNAAALPGWQMLRVGLWADTPLHIHYLIPTYLPNQPHPVLCRPILWQAAEAGVWRQGADGCAADGHPDQHRQQWRAPCGSPGTSRPGA